MRFVSAEGVAMGETKQAEALGEAPNGNLKVAA
jgi:hypothetical protein